MIQSDISHKSIFRKFEIKSENHKSLFTDSKRRQTAYRCEPDNVSLAQWPDSSQKTYIVCENRTQYANFTKSTQFFRNRIVYNLQNKNKHVSYTYNNIYNHLMIIQSTWISYIHHDQIIEHIRHNQNSKLNQKHLNRSLQVVNDLKRLINARVTKSVLFRRPFPFPKR